jgi:beta-lactam-binding protein with PASTA domain
MGAVTKEVLVRTIATIGACVLALAAAGCDAASNPGSTTTPPAQTGPSTVTEVQTATAVPQNGPAEEWVMPNLTGAVLQDAQDTIQAMTAGAVYFMASHDLGGQNRHQVMDDNWKVCDQNIAAGAPLSPSSKIDFGVVKIDETCP